MRRIASVMHLGTRLVLLDSAPIAEQPCAFAMAERGMRRQASPLLFPLPLGGSLLRPMAIYVCLLVP